MVLNVVLDHVVRPLLPQLGDAHQHAPGAADRAWPPQLIVALDDWGTRPR